MVSLCPAKPLKIDCCWGWDCSFTEYPCNFACAVALNAKLENQSNNRSSFFVKYELSRLPLDIPIGRYTAQPLARHTFIAENRPYLFAGIFCIPLIEQVLLGKGTKSFEKARIYAGLRRIGS